MFDVYLADVPREVKPPELSTALLRRSGIGEPRSLKRSDRCKLCALINDIITTKLDFDAGKLEDPEIRKGRQALLVSQAERLAVLLGVRDDKMKGLTGAKVYEACKLIIQEL